MIALRLVIQCLNCDVSLNDSAIMRSIKPFVNLTVLRVKTDFYVSILSLMIGIAAVLMRLISKIYS